MLHERHTTAAPARSRWITVHEVAQRLGKSEAAIYKMVARNLIPFTRIGLRGVRFEAERIEEWLARNSSE